MGLNNILSKSNITGLSNLDKALDLHKTGRLSDAKEIYLKLAKKNPKDANILQLIGSLLVQEQKYEQGIIYLKKSIECFPNLEAAHNNLGNALLALERHSEAIESYKRAIDLNKNYADAHSNLGNAYRKLDKLDEAISSYKAATTLNTNHIDAHNNLGNLYLDINKPDLAIIEYEKSYAIGEKKFQGVYGLA